MLPLIFSYPLQCPAQGAPEPEVVSLHLANLDPFTKSLNSILKPEYGAVLAGTPRITLRAPQHTPGSWA